MPTQHPKYNEVIYWETAGEMPKAGAFYAQKADHSLSWYAKYGCGDQSKWYVINRNIWNMENLVYRQKSANCYSPPVASTKALTTSDPSTGAFIALCQRDTADLDKSLGSKYPLVWLAPGCNSLTSISIRPRLKVEPEVEPKAPNYILPKIAPIPLFQPTTTTAPTLGPLGPLYTPGGGGGGTSISTISTIPKLSAGGGGGGAPTGPTGPVGPAGSCPWWYWLLVIGGGTALGAATYKKAQKGKKGKR